MNYTVRTNFAVVADSDFPEDARTWCDVNVIANLRCSTAITLTGNTDRNPL